MDEKKEALIKLYPMKTWYRELWSDFCTFATMVAIFGIGWWFDSSAMQWFGFVVALLIICGRSNARLKKFSPQEASNYLKAEYGVAPTPRGDRG